MHYHRTVIAQMNAQAAIPETIQGVRSTFNCRMPGNIVGAKVSVDLLHPNSNDVQINLLSPKGTSITLHDRSGGTPNLKQKYMGDVMRPLMGQEAEGNWSLQVVDPHGHNKGVLNNWRIELELSRDVRSVLYIDKPIGALIDGRAGVTSVISVPSSRSAACKAENMRIHLDIARTFITDLDIRLRTPGKKTIALGAKDGWTKRGERWTLAGSQLRELADQTINGDYTLSVAQGNSTEGGMLARWAIEFIHDSDISRVTGLDSSAAILALRKHENSVPLAHRLVQNRATA
jgi:subtilisin-like proprotein convertase family protein